MQEIYVKKFLLELANIDEANIQKIPLKLVGGLEKVLETEFKYKPLKIACPLLDDDFEANHEVSNLKEEIEKIKAVINEKEKQKKESIKNLALYLTQKINPSEIGSVRSETIYIAILSLISQYFVDNPEILTLISNAISHFLCSTDNLAKAFAGVRLIELFSLRQRQHIKKQFVWSGYFLSSTKSRYSEVDLTPEIRAEYNIPSDHTIFVDKYPFGYLCLPPYLKLYKSSEKLSENDTLLLKLQTREFVAQLIDRSIKEHEEHEELENAEDQGLDNCIQKEH